MKRSIPYLDGGGGCFSQLASITKHTKETLAIIEDNNHLLTLSHWCSLRTSNPCQPPPPSSHPLVVYSCYWSETKPHSGKHRKHSSPLPCSRACRQTIICCCQIFVFLDFDSATYSHHPQSHPRSPTIPDLSDHSQSSYPPLLQDTCLSHNPSAEWHFPAISACLEAVQAFRGSLWETFPTIPQQQRISCPKVSRHVTQSPVH